jgi:hypothetical protein
MAHQQVKSGSLWLFSGALALGAAILLGGPAVAQITIPGADGSDGAFSPTANIEVDLSQAPTGEWNGPNQDPGKGVYDPEKWAVVFRYTTVNIPNNVTVTFKNHPSRAPVVWLVQGDVTISTTGTGGTINVSGANGDYDAAQPQFAEPGPGGFRGGRGRQTSAAGSGGFGPGGAGYSTGSRGTGGSYGTQGSVPTGGGPAGPVYGHPRVLPLIGGSGGAGTRGTLYYHTLGAGAGGGAILIATQTTIRLSGAVYARGGNGGSETQPYGGAGGGSGGGIRLVADTITGGGTLAATGGSSTGGGAGGAGRIRVEANTIDLSHPGDPPYTAGPPGDPATIWPSDDAPTVYAISLAGQAVPADPRASLTSPLADVTVSSPSPLPLIIEAHNVPVDWNVVARVVVKVGEDFNVPATLIGGNQTLSTWQADITLPSAWSAIQVRAAMP